MKKRGFLSIYVLIILTLLSITLSFIFEQTRNNNDLNKDIYNKKKAIYQLESIYNILLDDKKKLIERLEEINNFDTNSRYKFEFPYFEEKKSVKIQKKSDNYFVIRKTQIVGDSKAKLLVLLNLKEKYNLKTEDKIILKDKFNEFYHNLKFKNREFKEYEDFTIEKDNYNLFVKVDNDLKIKKDKKLILSDSNTNKNNFSNLDSNKKDFSNKTKTARKISGIVIIGKDLILENDLILDGLLIIKGDIISINNSKITVNGQIISKDDYNGNILKYFYKKKRSLDYINDIENPKYIKVKSKKVF